MYILQQCGINEESEFRNFLIAEKTEYFIFILTFERSYIT